MADEIVIVDTGSTDVVIPGKLAEELKLPIGFSGYAHTAGGTVKIYATHLDELTLGHITIKNIPATINPGMRSNQVILGMSALKHVDFSQQGNSLILSVSPK